MSKFIIDLRRQYNPNNCGDSLYQELIKSLQSLTERVEALESELEHAHKLLRSFALTVLEVDKDYQRYKIDSTI